MDITALLYPTLTLVAWTVCIGLSLMCYRFYLVYNQKIHPGYFKLNRGGKPPARHDALADNYSNLFEVTTLYYAVIAIAIALQHINSQFLTLAWVYIGLRIIHSLIHIAYNHVLHRLAAFFASLVVLLAMWINLVTSVA